MRTGCIKGDAPQPDAERMAPPGQAPTSLLRLCLGQLAPGVPVVLCGRSGTGRTVLALECLAEQLARGERALFLTAEPPRLVLDQARSLGLDLESPLREERLVLLELAAEAAQLLFSTGAAALRGALAEAAAGASLVVIDPLTALISEFLEERELRSLVRELFAGSAEAGQVTLLTCAREALDATPLFERVLKESSGAWVSLSAEAGRRTLHVEKARLAGARGEPVPFEIAVGGCRILAAPDAPLPPLVGPPPAAGGSAARPPRARRKLLVVEDDGLLREMYEDWLRERYDVVTAEDGFAGLSAVLREHPDLLVLDLNLPRVSGFEVLRALRGSGSRIPVLVVSGILRTSDRLRALVLGAADVIGKPLPRFQLQHKIESLLQHAEPAAFDYQTEDAEALLDVDGRTRLLCESDFGERVGRAQRFGREFGMESLLVFMESRTVEARDALLGAAEAALRAEDALFAVDKLRLAALLVCCEPANLDPILRRFAAGVAERGAEARDLQYRALTVSEWSQEQRFESGFEALRRWPALPAR